MKRKRKPIEAHVKDFDKMPPKLQKAIVALIKAAYQMVNKEK